MDEEELREKAVSAAVRMSAIDDSDELNLKYILENEDIPPWIKDVFVFAKVHQLTYYDDRDIERLLHRFDQRVLAYLATRGWSPTDYTFVDDYKVEIARDLFHALVKRSLKGFEREMETRQSREISIMTGGKGGSLRARLGGLFGGGW
ncbi:MAG: hypothetical protein H0Z19_05285 [Archaeoglobus sp.]|uniref:hypothetical protein n=1 Tax=Archaeoglobus sp. TaxID=1872626 RepID=UPI001D641BEB|nr:hypothetical protein [Archaeoglobus sp.]MBO8179881.1 hypothetical protein [Archaeoglobus sp.]